MLAVTGSMPMPICNSFRERLPNYVTIVGQLTITTFTGLPLFDVLVRRFP